MPRLVIVCGAPGAGKTTLARRLATDLRWPLVVRDDIKEALMDALGCETPERSRELGVASYAAMFAVLEGVVRAGVNAIVETNFRRAVSEPALQSFVDRCDTAQIHCSSSESIARFRTRVRHPGHFPEAVLGRMHADVEAGRFEPLDFSVPLLQVECSDGYRPAYADVLAFAGGV